MQRIARKVKVNGFTFDSQKEANFYLKFVKKVDEKTSSKTELEDNLRKL